MKNNLKFVLIVTCIVLWALAAIGIFLYMIAQQFKCSFLKACIYAVLCVVIPGALFLFDFLETRVSSFFRNRTALPVYLTEYSMKLISIGVTFLAVAALVLGIVLAVDKMSV